MLVEKVYQETRFRRRWHKPVYDSDKYLPMLIEVPSVRAHRAAGSQSVTLPNELRKTSLS